MSKDSIEISPKYGVNPTIPVCFFCHEDKNELALMGRIRERDRNGRAVRNSDEPAPHRMILDYCPCDKCKAIMDSGITMIGVKPSDGKHMEIQKGVYPTGAFTVLKPEAFERIFKDAMEENMLHEVMEKKCVFMDSDELVAFIKNANQ